MDLAGSERLKPYESGSQQDKAERGGGVREEMVECFFFVVYFFKNFLWHFLGVFLVCFLLFFFVLMVFF